MKNNQKDLRCKPVNDASEVAKFDDFLRSLHNHNAEVRGRDFANTAFIDCLVACCDKYLYLYSGSFSGSLRWQGSLGGGSRISRNTTKCHAPVT